MKRSFTDLYNLFLDAAKARFSSPSKERNKHRKAVRRTRMGRAKLVWNEEAQGYLPRHNAAGSKLSKRFTEGFKARGY